MLINQNPEWVANLIVDIVAAAPANATSEE
jgi:hypothetical protein